MVSLSHTQLRPRAPQTRIEILGVFGSGKTYLARQLELARLSERHTRNRFWGSTVPKVYGYLAYDVDFLLDHFYLAATLRTIRKPAICDWSFITDLLWASLRLNSDDLAAYKILHRRLTGLVSPPVGYVYLKYPAELVLARINSRGRAIEQKLSVEDVANALDQVEAIVRELPPSMVFTCTEDSKIANLKEQILSWATTHERD
jgi:deoxyadenosine/deoxycytidine kinase